MSKPYAVVFTGVPGSSKSIVAHELSCQFSLPIFSTDNIRYEVREDLRVDDINIPHALAEFEKRYRERWQGFLTHGISIIRDGSVDRTWDTVRSDLQTAGYDWFMINMGLTQGFMEKLYLATGRPNSARQLPMYQSQHEAFLQEHASDVDLQITDETFPDRRFVAVAGLQRFLNERQTVAI